MTYSDIYSDTYDSDGAGVNADAPLSVTASLTAVAALNRAWVADAALPVVATLTSVATRGRIAQSSLAVTASLTCAATVTAAVVPGAVTGSARSRLRAFLPNGADQGPLPGPEQVNASYVLNDVGALTFGYAPQAPRSNLLGQPLEVALEVSLDGGVTWLEPPNSRFVYVADGRNPLDPSDRYSVECKSYVWRLSKAVVLPNGLLNNDGKRAFLSANVGVILKTLLNEAQARGALTGVIHSSFGTGTDSAGAAWNKTLTIYYEPGIDYLTVLLNLAEQGFCDFRTSGRALQVYNADTALAADRTVGSPQVILRAGRDLTEAPFRRTWEALANYAYFAGENTSYEFTNPGASVPWGRQETFISNGSVSDSGTMASLTQAQLALTNAERIEHTRGLDFTRATERPFTHYGVGDYVWSAVDGTAPERLRIRQLTLTQTNGTVLSGNVVLNDRFLEADVRQQRRIEGITNGASSGTGTGGPTPGADSKPPAQVVGLAGSSTAYFGPGGFAQAQVSLNWTPVTTNSDGTPASDIDHYEIFRRVLGSTVGQERLAGTAVDADFDQSPYQTGSSWWFSVRAADVSGNRGAKSSEVLIGMASDATPPQAPSTPVVTSKLGILRVAWDGLPATGFWASDLNHVDVHVSTVNNFTPSAATKFDTLYGAGVTVVTNGVYGIPLYVKFIAVDHAGNVSPASAQATGTPARLVGSDISAEAITYEQIGFKDPGNIVMDGSVETATYRAILTARSHAAWTFTTADFFHGDWCATINATTGTGTTRQLVWVPAAEAQQILAGDKLFCRFAYKGSVGADGVLQLVVTWVLRDGTTSTTTLPGSVKNGTWQQAAGQLTAPANVQEFWLAHEVSAAAATGTYSVDAVEVRRTVGTAIIQDAAITNAQIANLAVNDAKISSLDVGKLTAGSLTADVLVAGSIKTATAGARVEMTPSGIRLFDAAGLNSVEISATSQYLRLRGTGDVSAVSTTHALQIGPNTGPNTRFDNNEIAAYTNGVPTDLALNLSGADVHMANTVKARRFGAGTGVGGICSDDADLGVVCIPDLQSVRANEVRIVNAVNTAYRDFVCASLLESSSSARKIKRSDFDPIQILLGARSQKWQYRPGFAVDGRWHYGPMADDLPEELVVGKGEDMAVSVGSLVGVLWEAVRVLSLQVAKLEKK